MKISVLTENLAGIGFLAEHGLSYLLETEDEKLLFDTGHSDIFLKNAKKLGLNIETQVKTVVLSHGHWDHGDGLQYISNKNLVAHPDVFMHRYRKKDNSHVGLHLTKQQIAKKFKLVTSRKPLYVSEHIIFLGEIPRKTDFEAQTTSFIDEYGGDDFVMDDSAIAVVMNDSLSVISGCSHAGIGNIVNHAIKSTGIKRIKAIVGGFHLKKNDEQTQKTIKFLSGLNPEMVIPSHCTELPALEAFHKHFGGKKLTTGMVLEI